MIFCAKRGEQNVRDQQYYKIALVVMMQGERFVTSTKKSTTFAEKIIIICSVRSKPTKAKM